ncbi:MAG: hypothetical protein H0X24_05965 [Ktedonobacterales bacterium]|nr:hypothetical protein [Ktedonobacterales bacterium]
MSEKLRDNGGQLALFLNFSIRRTWHDGEWWYSLVDCMVPLSDTTSAKRYWSDLKRKLKREGAKYEDFVLSLPMPTKTGKMQGTDCANKEGVLRIVQSISHKNAEPFKEWLARVGRTVMDLGEERTLRAQNRAQLDRADRDLHEIVVYYGIVTPNQHADLIDANFAGLYAGRTELDLLRERGGFPGSLPDRMGQLELAANTLQRALVQDKVQRDDIRGVLPITDAARETGALVRRTLAEAGSTMPEEMPQYFPLPPGEWMPDDHPSRIQWDTPAEIAGEDDGGPDMTIREIIAPE